MNKIENYFPAIKRIAPHDRPAVTAVLTAALLRCPMMRWLYPEPERYLRCFPDWLGYYAGDPYVGGNGIYYEGLESALLWLRPDMHQNVSGLMSYMMETVPKSRHREVECVFERLNGLHPREPFWMMTILGVDPLHGGRKLGEMLFRHGIDLTCQASVPAYCEASSKHSLRIYESIGWEAIGEVQAGNSPPFFPMVLKPGRPYSNTSPNLTE